MRPMMCSQDSSTSSRIAGVVRPQARGQRDGHCQFGRQAWRDAEEAPWRDADDRHGYVFDEQRPADHAGVAAKSLLPRAVTQHCDRLAPVVMLAAAGGRPPA